MANTDERMISALERIATALETSVIDVDGLASMVNPPEMPTIPTQWAGDPDGYDVEERVALPADGYFIHFSSDRNAPSGFQLWLVGPGGTAYPLQVVQ